MLKVTIIGVDLAKNVFQLHGATEDGTVVFRKKLTRPLFERFMAGHHPCTVAMEASAGAHHWARQFQQFGHQVRIIAAKFVAPYRLSGKRGKNDAADAEARGGGIAREANAAPQQKSATRAPAGMRGLANVSDGRW